ncbi:hypothetical protein BN381_150103 [Candidatus Microthrix parvicella RN1]|uniref:Uncharacterized protein n=1 Tax=Candidatus Neomicrothrix parvicella RN1 TaxID=1229780 RepID=R4YXP1_9ACTN|nr:hypothetical protein BN381_150103 [Candidatus Microthrix parvicella RN1]
MRSVPGGNFLAVDGAFGPDEGQPQEGKACSNSESTVALRPEFWR